MPQLSQLSTSSSGGRVESPEGRSSPSCVTPAKSAIGFTHLAACIPPPLVGGGWGRGLAPVGANDSCSSVGKSILWRAAARQPLPLAPAHKGRGNRLGLSLRCVHSVRVR